MRKASPSEVAGRTGSAEAPASAAPCALRTSMFCGTGAVCRRAPQIAARVDVAEEASVSAPAAECCLRTSARKSCASATAAASGRPAEAAGNSTCRARTCAWAASAAAAWTRSSSRSTRTSAPAHSRAAAPPRRPASGACAWAASAAAARARSSPRWARSSCRNASTSGPALSSAATSAARSTSACSARTCAWAASTAAMRSPSSSRSRYTSALALFCTVASQLWRAGGGMGPAVEAPVWTPASGCAQRTCSEARSSACSARTCPAAASAVAVQTRSSSRWTRSSSPSARTSALAFSCTAHCSERPSRATSRAASSSACSARTWVSVLRLASTPLEHAAPPNAGGLPRRRCATERSWRRAESTCATTGMGLLAAPAATMWVVSP
mmetsp:Transcript_9104/g.25444  ORF Transcript_9104/g.25444 Transcript_9104/m.25444 type:complete len:384 (-) Transcript_9104:94-1245(-)